MDAASNEATIFLSIRGARRMEMRVGRAALLGDSPTVDRQCQPASEGTTDRRSFNTLPLYVQ